MQSLSFLNVSLLQIRLFISVMEQSSFSQAAAANYVEQSTLSRQIARLEQQLGLKLFYRGSHPIRPTREGKILYERWKPFLAEYCDLIRQVKTSGGRINIYTYDYLTIIRDIPALRMRLNESALCGNFNFQVISLASNWRELLTSGEADMVLSVFHDFHPEDASIRAVKLQDYRVTVSMLGTNPLSRKKSITLDDLKTQNFITIASEVRPSISESLGRIFGSRCGYRPRIVRTVKSAFELTGALQNDNEVVLGATFIREAANPLIKTYKLPIRCSSLYAVWKAENENAAICSEVAAAAKEFWKKHG